MRGDRVGTLVFDPGGPGNEGKDWLLHKDFFTSQVHDRFDIVGFDPRGAGESQPITCDPTLVAALPTSDPSTPQGFADAVAYNRKLAADCRQRSGRCSTTSTISVRRGTLRRSGPRWARTG